MPDNTGIRVKVKVVKNKVAAPYKAVHLDILFGSGIDRFGCTLDAAQELGIIERKGSWYAYKGNNVAQGRSGIVELLKRDEAMGQQVEEEVRIALSSIVTQVEDDRLTRGASNSLVDSEDSYLEA